MSTTSSVTNIWNNIKEIDLRPLREDALRLVRIVIAGAPGSGRNLLAGQLRRDPHRPDEQTQSPLLVVDLEKARQIPDCDLVILMIGPQPGTRPDDFTTEKTLMQGWANSGRKVLVFVNQAGPGPGQPWLSWGYNPMLYGPVDDAQFLLHYFVPLILEMLPDRHLALGRAFPLFRVTIAHHLVNDTCISNAVYALSTGLAEVVPVLDIPLNVTDLIVLTKNQAFLAYKLGLVLGFSTEWRDYLAEFGSVLGSGFLWRQAARSLVGLIPAWGILPKVAISYAGTFVVGNAILRWYLTGKHLTRQQIGQLYSEALARGKHTARELMQRIPRPRLPQPRLPQLGKGKDQPAKAKRKTGRCPACGRKNPRDAMYCAYCAQPLELQIVIDAGPQEAGAEENTPPDAEAGASGE